MAQRPGNLANRRWANVHDRLLEKDHSPKAGPPAERSRHVVGGARAISRRRRRSDEQRVHSYSILAPHALIQIKRSRPSTHQAGGSHDRRALRCHRDRRRKIYAREEPWRVLPSTGRSRKPPVARGSEHASGVHARQAVLPDNPHSASRQSAQAEWLARAKHCGHRARPSRSTAQKRRRLG